MINKRVSQTSKKYAKGFTLIEMVIVIVILGVMAMGITSFITLSTQTYVNVTDRDELIANARFVVERLNREIRNAVPNSVRVKDDGTRRQCIEFVPIVASTIYTDIPVAPEPASYSLDVIQFQNVDGTLYECGNGSSCSDKVIVYPLNDTDVYQYHFDDKGKIFRLKMVEQMDPLWKLTLASVAGKTGVLFDHDSPTQRLYVVNSPVSYCLEDNTIVRYAKYSLSANQSLNPRNVPKVLMAEYLAPFDTNNKPFIIQATTLQRNANVQIKLHFVKSDEDFVFNNEVHLQNTP